MKTLYFVRHAKSSWKDFNLRDHDRPLNSRGKRDAPKMAARLVALAGAPDGLLTSTAKRAKTTARSFREAAGLSKDAVLEREELYHAAPREIEAVIKELPADWDTVFVFGHNPGYTDLANRLINNGYIDNVPTCGIVEATSDVAKWRDFKLSEARRGRFLYPKDGG
ncbi:histidine phosphatase family protein [Lewinella sp. 4G2]|uniref:SixA phosphatase family protein n=1 Tax=Lewinella sp. 4G2 TaxID=1803372 RepID=UPI0007B4E6FB|nr:histidine phosphatase family protein [Lewinella sp. 4G2]OAV46169.1 hypothetical protein A3850_018080 [Lewinella sp. 4G2]